MRGHGESDLGNKDPGLDVLARDLFDLLEALNVESAHFVGQSIGAMTLLAFASNYKELPATFMIFDAVARSDSEWDSRYSERANLVEQQGLDVIALESAKVSLGAETQIRKPYMVERYAAMIASTPTNGYAWACRAMLGFDYRAQLAEISAPVMVAAGDQDTITTLSDAKEIADAVPGAVLAEVRGSGHVPCLERPNVMTAMIRSWTTDHSI
jgi:pimeloyl-ACP methyl ester carboxylesterase